MIPFWLMRFIWISLGIYIKVINKKDHPVNRVLTYETFDKSVKVILIPTLWDNYSYIIVSGNDAIVIDPSDYKAILKEIKDRKLRLNSIVITHEHIDHVIGINQLQKKHGSPIYAPKNAIPGKITVVENGYKIPFGDVYLEAVVVPGHHSWPYPISSFKNNIAWYCSKASVLFTGDTLFSCGYGFMAKGHEREMWESLKKIRSFPDETLMFCGHEYSLMTTAFAASFDPENIQLKKRINEVQNLIKNRQPTIPTTLGLEKAINPWLRWDDEKLIKKHGINKEGFESFMEIRKIKNEILNKK